jgi:hypothetical protein
MNVRSFAQHCEVFRRHIYCGCMRPFVPRINKNEITSQQHCSRPNPRRQYLNTLATILVNIPTFGVFAFDNSSGHACKADDALVASRMNLLRALWRGAGPRRATGVNTPWPSARTARAPTSRRRTPARRRRRPAATRRGGGPPPPRGGSEARPRRQKSHRPTPRRHRGAGWRWRRSTSPLRRRPWRSRGHEADRTEGG